MPELRLAVGTMASRISIISQALANRVPDAALTSRSPLLEDSSIKAIRGALTTKNILALSSLPTPPNSISPNLPPHGLSAEACKEFAAPSPCQIDSDIDLQDAVDQAHHSQDQRELSALPEDSVEGHGIITSNFLAMHHLPDIVLDKGPVAIRHIMLQLAERVHGFSDIPQAKARRMVVSALETRAGGVTHDVEFEKVGWGRWIARSKGDQLKEGNGIYSIDEFKPSSARSSTAALRIPHGSTLRPRVRRSSHVSYAASSLVSPSLTARSGGDDDIDIMSINGDFEDRFRKYKAPQSYDDYYSDTDEEDWASIGPSSLRQSSLSSMDFKTFSQSRRASARFSVTALPKSTPANARPSFPSRKSSTVPNLDFAGVRANTQEREAIEALMHMGSM